MAQHDYDIANQSGANFRTDLNNALDAIVSNNSGSSAPSTTFAYEWWIDTSNNLLKLRNSANNAWITIPISITADNATSGALTVNGNLSTTGTVDINGQELILDADADTSITADTDDQIDFRVGAVDVMTLTNSHLVMKGTTPKITIGDGGEEDTALIFDGNAQDFYIGLDDSADDLLIGTGSTVGSNAKVAIENGGNVGIGTQTPAYRLDVVHDNVGESTVAQFGGDGGAGSIPDVRIVNSNQSSGSTDEGARLIFQLGSTNAAWLQAFKEADGTSAGNRSGGLAFYTSNANSVTEKMRIDAAGNLVIGATTTRTGTSSMSLEPTNSYMMFRQTGSSAVSQIQFFRNTDSSATFAGGIATTGTTTTYSTSSDYRLKENVNYEFDALSRVAQLKPARFNFISNEDTTVDGFLAHEVSDIVPEAITGEKDAVNEEGEPDYQGIDQSKLVPLLTKAIQEQQTQIEALQSEINTLKGE
tara:strand:+ start:6390 stop:7814 length:1425 start_codon:yes stop_codon:yes gene_type:complete